MQTFFHGWRRKMGVVALVMACLVTGLWVRTLFFADQFCFVIGDRKHYINSGQSGLTWLSIDRSPMLEWHTVIPAEEFEQIKLSRPLTQSLNETFAILTDRGTNPACRYLLYWWLALPLTLLSAYLILWKPRKAAQPTPKAERDINSEL
jgi:hypothetical protein